METYVVSSKESLFLYLFQPARAVFMRIKKMVTSFRILLSPQSAEDKSDAIFYIIHGWRVKLQNLFIFLLPTITFNSKQNICGEIQKGISGIWKKTNWPTV